MSVYQELKAGQTFLSLTGLGYVGLPIAIAFSNKIKVIGYDFNEDKVNLFKNGVDPTKEVGDDAIRNATVDFTSNPEKLMNAKFHIVAVPTPIHNDHSPDLTPVESASHTLGKNLAPGSIVVYESTVYPGVTEEICIPILESESKLKCGVDFKVGYSPERINPGDRVHRLENIVKVVSGMDEDTLEEVAAVYSLVAFGGVYRARSIKVAEAAKVIENSQRDINIAFMNELAMIFHRIGIDTLDVLNAARTKWNFLDFRPGLVGGHCIGIDPYYLTYKAETVGYHSQIILSGRRINDEMGKYVAENLIKRLIRNDVQIRGAIVAILGFTFKENCPDLRNSKVMDIYNELLEYGITPVVSDPVAEKKEALNLYGLEFINVKDICNADAVIVAVGHQEFVSYTPEEIKKFYKDNSGKKTLFDVKGIYSKEAFESSGFDYWRL